MVDTARYFLDFLSDESCGKCVPCREGIRQMLDILTRITEGKGGKADIELLEDVATMVKNFALRAGHLCSQPRAVHPPIFPGRISGPY
jgi:NADH:ubiquinone oxidoreductase subunit F (NADH-binding)